MLHAAAHPHLTLAQQHERAPSPFHHESLLGGLQTPTDRPSTPVSFDFNVDWNSPLIGRQSAAAFSSPMDFTLDSPPAGNLSAVPSYDFYSSSDFLSAQAYQELLQRALRQPEMISTSQVASAVPTAALPVGVPAPQEQQDLLTSYDSGPAELHDEARDLLASAGLVAQDLLAHVYSSSEEGTPSPPSSLASSISDRDDAAMFDWDDSASNASATSSSPTSPGTGAGPRLPPARRRRPVAQRARSNNPQSQVRQGQRGRQVEVPRAACVGLRDEHFESGTAQQCLNHLAAARRDGRRAEGARSQQPGLPAPGVHATVGGAAIYHGQPAIDAYCDSVKTLYATVKPLDPTHQTPTRWNNSRNDYLRHVRRYAVLGAILRLCADLEALLSVPQVPDPMIAWRQQAAPIVDRCIALLPAA